ncbi:MAG: hypothetical protein KatS3mg087_1281 [Patescibacteria group bacterium]|nr:MAG: hypothetical protein KatS3mg087_1281 [Patescibacteria group bacterium]
MIWLIRVLFLLLISYWSYELITQPVPWIFIDGVNLLFHEAGHVIFIPFGQVMMVLGGSMLQCLIPAFIFGYFLYTRQWYAAAFALFWLGNNFINVSVYIRDAEPRVLPLLGGDSSGHDWYWLMTNVGRLEWAVPLANMVWSVGVLCLVTAIGGYVYRMIVEYVGSYN